MATELILLLREYSADIVARVLINIASDRSQLLRSRVYVFNGLLTDAANQISSISLFLASDFENETGKTPYFRIKAALALAGVI